MNDIDRNTAISIAKEFWLDVDFSAVETRQIPDRVPGFARERGELAAPGAPAIVSQEEVKLIEYGRYLIGYSRRLNVLLVGRWEGE